MNGCSFTVVVAVNFESWVSRMEVVIVAPLVCFAETIHSPMSDCGVVGCCANESEMKSKLISTEARKERAFIVVLSVE